MSDRPNIFYNPRGEVTVSIEWSGHTIYSKYSPETAKHIANDLLLAAQRAEKMREANKKAEEERIARMVSTEQPTTGASGYKQKGAIRTDTPFEGA